MAAALPRLAGPAHRRHAGAGAAAAGTRGAWPQPGRLQCGGARQPAGAAGAGRRGMVGTPSSPPSTPGSSWTRSVTSRRCEYGRARLRWIDDTVNVGQGHPHGAARADGRGRGDHHACAFPPNRRRVLFQLEDRSPAYRQLQVALARYRMLAADSALTTLPRFPRGSHRDSGTPARRPCAGCSWRWATCPTHWRCRRSRPTRSTTPRWCAA